MPLHRIQDMQIHVIWNLTSIRHSRVAAPMISHRGFQLMSSIRRMPRMQYLEDASDGSGILRNNVRVQRVAESQKEVEHLLMTASLSADEGETPLHNGYLKVFLEGTLTSLSADICIEVQEIGRR